MYVCVCVCVYIHTYICIYTCMYILPAAAAVVTVDRCIVFKMDAGAAAAAADTRSLRGLSPVSLSLLGS